ncbi:hypothetical protein Moror_16130 [Moniliophthora roreri MCA 2997]|uniref:Uncharacterized protein n=1 Tax=Moniliophthora roreri (strain MCA 2997) TaxID=1381753 RepID=V2X9I3_MONRO|nr:hypothetical protein Moror_16130 [Moniliophthora roreri MCA 2997]
MFFSKSSLAVVAAIVAAVQANDGNAFLNNTATHPTRACGVCPPTNLKVALPVNRVNPFPCLFINVSTVNGVNTQGIYTDDCLNCVSPNGVDGDITLSPDLYNQFNQPPPVFGPIVWNA